MIVIVSFSSFILKDARNLRSKGIEMVWTVIENRNLPMQSVVDKSNLHSLCCSNGFGYFFPQN